MLILTTKRDVTSSVLHNFGAENKRFVRVARISFCSVLGARSALGAPALLIIFLCNFDNDGENKTDNCAFCYIREIFSTVLIGNHLRIVRPDLKYCLLPLQRPMTISAGVVGRNFFF